MKRIEPKDLYVGRELICVRSRKPNWHTIGSTYKVDGVYRIFHDTFYRINTNDTSSLFDYSLAEIMGHGSWGCKFILPDFLTEIELFTFKISGKLPERYVFSD